MERERLVEDATHDGAADADSSPSEVTGPDFDIDVDRAVGHEILLDDTTWIQ